MRTPTESSEYTVLNAVYRSFIFGRFLGLNHMKKCEKSYFAASNTGDGFVNYYDLVFAPDERIYILKGGPGTGKSYFLKEVGKAAEMRGLEHEKYYCSSDPDSLDGIRIPALGIAFWDGTAPHTVDPRVPGAREEILNLGQFWQGEKLREHRDTIMALSEKKSDVYAMALSMLSLAAECMRYRLSLLTPFVKRDKMDAAAGRFLAKYKPEKGRAVPRPMRTYGMKGERILPTFTEGAETVHKLSELYGVEYLYLQVLLHRARAEGVGVEYSPHPLCPDLPEALYFTDVHVLVSAMPGQTGRAVGTRRFLDSAVFARRGRLLRFLGKGMQELTDAALLEFSEMRGYHFALEEIYGGAMDFAGKEAFTLRFLEELFG